MNELTEKKSELEKKKQKLDSMIEEESKGEFEFSVMSHLERNLLMFHTFLMVYVLIYIYVLISPPPVGT